MSKYLSTREVAKETGFSLQKVRHLIANGLLPAKDTSTGSRPRYIVRRGDLERFLTPVGSAPEHAGA